MVKFIALMFLQPHKMNKNDVKFDFSFLWILFVSKIYNYKKTIKILNR